jgi:hypothetical protein
LEITASDARELIAKLIAIEIGKTCNVELSFDGSEPTPYPATKINAPEPEPEPGLEEGEFMSDGFSVSSST